MTGLVLCGGQSTRMQKDKGLLLLGGEIWAQRMVNMLSGICSRVVVSIHQQQNAYREILSDCSFVADDASLGLHGPLSGLFSVHASFPEDDLFVLACDMQLMPAEVPEFLIEKWSLLHAVESAVFRQQDGSPEPMCGIYSSRGLKRMYKVHKRQGLPRYSMKYLLGQMNVHYEPIPDKWQSCFTNFNTPEDIIRLV